MNNNKKVIIIGAGPTGLMMACQLARFNVDFIIIDSKKGPTKESRALVIQARSLEIYEQMDIAEKAINMGQFMTKMHIYQDGKERAKINIGEAGKSLTDFSYILSLEQSKNEELLLETLQKLGHDVLWQHELIDLENTEAGITATIKNPKNQQQTVKARYAVGCDGAKSPIRHILNLKFEGGTYKNRFIVADVVMKSDLGHEDLILFPANQNFYGFFPLKETNHYRLIGTLPREYEQKENLQFKDIEEEVRSTIQLPVIFEEVNWFSTYLVHHRCVENFRVKNCFLAGDSAHVHSPAGGQGMNTGLQDAYNLAWKMAYVLQEKAPESLLNTYQEERRPFAEKLLKSTDTAFKFVSNDHKFISWFRSYIVLPIIGIIFNFNITHLKLKIFKTISQIGIQYKDSSLSINASTQPLKFKAGQRAPYNNIYQHLKSPKHHLLIIADKSKITKEDEELIKQETPTLKTLQIDHTDSWKKLGLTKKLYLLIRPDNYIAVTSDELKDIENYLKKI